ncbi:MAG: epoxyqueuosine reductase QueH [Candidatus Caldatribacteriaceae bacterium]
MKERLLLHTCCAPCHTVVRDFLEEQGFAVSTLFYNPNIHPFDEYKRRYETLWEYLLKIGKEPPLSPFPYNPLEYFEVIKEPENRCPSCYRLRLLRVAQWGKEHGFPFFSTTLVVSPYQEVEGLLMVGKELGKEIGISFVGFDLREKFPQSVQRAKEMKLYRQNYCGCIFSWWEGVKRKIWKSLTGRGSF